VKKSKIAQNSLPVP